MPEDRSCLSQAYNAEWSRDNPLHLLSPKPHHFTGVELIASPSSSQSFPPIGDDVKMKSMQRKFGTFLKRSDNESDIQTVLEEFKAVDGMLEHVRDRPHW